MIDTANHPRAMMLSALLLSGCDAGRPGAAYHKAENSDGFVISGRVEDPFNLKPEGATLMVASHKGGGSFSSRPVALSADGSFVTHPLRPRTYVLQLIRTPHSPTKPATLVGLTIVPMTKTDVTGVSVGIRRDTQVTGRYRMVSDDPAAAWPMHIHVLALLAVDGGMWSGGNISEGAPGGRFILRNAFGPRVLRTGYTLSPGHRWWPDRVLLDGANVTNVPTDFSQHEDAELEVLFTQHPGRISGTVVHSDGRPVSRAWVFIAAEDPKLWQPWATTSHVVRADADGSFQVVTVPGRYVARAHPPDMLTSVRHAKQHIAQIGPGGMPVELAEREQKKITLTLDASGPR